ncbi:MAG: Translation elongation factor P, partial [uncultured Acetobacteraceae bacterium]
GEDAGQPDARRHGHRVRRPALHRAQAEHHDPRQGQRHHSGGHAQHQDRRQEGPALAHRRHGRAVDDGRQGLQLLLRRGRQPGPDGPRHLRADHRAQGHPRRPPALPGREHDGQCPPHRGRAGRHVPAGNGGAGGGRGRPRGEKPDRHLLLQAGGALQRREDHGAPLRHHRREDRGEDRGRFLRGAGEGL